MTELHLQTAVLIFISNKEILKKSVINCVVKQATKLLKKETFNTFKVENKTSINENVTGLRAIVLA